jgi:hypothetical protein
MNFTSYTLLLFTPVSHPKIRDKSPTPCSVPTKCIVLSSLGEGGCLKWALEPPRLPGVKWGVRVMKSGRVSVTQFGKAKWLWAVVRMQCSFLPWAWCRPVWEGSTVLTAFIFSMLWWIWNLHPARDRINLLQHKSLDHFSFKCGKTALRRWKVWSTS